MYRTSELRFSEAAADIPEMTSDKRHRLANEKRVEIGSRIEMLQTLTGHKWVGEASHTTATKQPLGPNAEQKIAISLLDDLGLAHCFDSIERGGKYYSWVQFAINHVMLDIFMDSETTFSVLEEGAVYGYPISSSLAFAGIIPAKKAKQKSVANYYLSGVNSEKYYDRETKYTDMVWRHLCEIAPGLTTEAYEEYMKRN